MTTNINEKSTKIKQGRKSSKKSTNVECRQNSTNNQRNSTVDENLWEIDNRTPTKIFKTRAEIDDDENLRKTNDSFISTQFNETSTNIERRRTSTNKRRTSKVDESRLNIRENRTSTNIYERPTKSNDDETERKNHENGMSTKSNNKLAKFGSRRHFAKYHRKSSLDEN